jgi:sugar phosphate isomerase/epimerase
MPWGSTIHSELEKRGTFDFEIDTFWAFNAGIDPVETLKRLSGRVKVIHLKDGFKGGAGKSLGQGEAPVLKVREYAVKNNIRMVVESEGLDPTGLEEVKRCIDFLKAQE